MFEFNFDAELDDQLEISLEVDGEQIPDWLYLGEDVWVLNTKEVETRSFIDRDDP